jgi:hypothetical protein
MISSHFFQNGGMVAIAAVKHWDLKPLLFGLLFLCFADASFTDIGLRLFLIDELNPLVKRLYEWNIIGYYAMKLLLPLFLILIYYRTNNRVWLNPCILVTALLYFIVNIYHFIWISYVA